AGPVGGVQACGLPIFGQDVLGAAERAIDAGDRAVQGVARDLDERRRRLSASLDRPLASVDRTLGGADDVLADGSQLRYSLVTALDELAEAAQSIRVLADYLERNPSSLVFGKGRVSK